MSVYPVLLNSRWHQAKSTATFQSHNPSTGEALPNTFPISDWHDIDLALSHAAAAAEELRRIDPAVLADFLARYAARIEARAAELVDAAHAETALPKSPRLLTIELPRTTAQLRQAAAAALDGAWALPTFDTRNNIRSYHAAIGPVLVLGPNNFPLAFNAISGGDFAAAIAAGNPVIAKAHPDHANTTRLLAEEARAAAGEAGLPPGTIQLIYHMSNDTGLRAAADPRLGALAFTGSRRAGLALKAAADAAGKPAYLEMSSLNPLVILPGALRERLARIADEYADSALAAAGQFCTNPGLVLLLDSPETLGFIAAVQQRFDSRAAGTLLSKNVHNSLSANVAALVKAGAEIMTGGAPAPGQACAFKNTLLHIAADKFLSDPHTLQTEAFGNAALFVSGRTEDQLAQVIAELEGQLTACIYSATTGEDDALYTRFAPLLRRRVGRLLNDKMPTGVALSPAMNHGGPYPATGHPGFTAVGIPASLRRFTQLESFDNVRPARLPAILRNANLPQRPFRSVDGAWTRDDLTA